MNEVRLPIETKREGDEITKVCVEDSYKFLNRIIEPFNRMSDKVIDITDSLHQEYGDYEGEFIIGVGTSKPCEGDVFNEEIGNEIAFRKAKLKANLKKHHIISRIVNHVADFCEILLKEDYILSKYIRDDTDAIREYNKDFYIR